MKKIFIIFASLMASVTIAVFFSGCVAAVVGAGAGVGTYAYVKGEMKSVEQASLDKTWSAVEKTVKDMGFFVVSKSRDALAGVVEARGAGDKKITIKVSLVTDKTTEVGIRVGTFGDEKYSYQILENIRKNM